MEDPPLCWLILRLRHVNLTGCSSLITDRDFEKVVGWSEELESLIVRPATSLPNCSWRILQALVSSMTVSLSLPVLSMLSRYFLLSCLYLFSLALSSLRFFYTHSITPFASLHSLLPSCLFFSQCSLLLLLVVV